MRNFVRVYSLKDWEIGLEIVWKTLEIPIRDKCHTQFFPLKSNVNCAAFIGCQFIFFFVFFNTNFLNCLNTQKQNCQNSGNSVKFFRKHF